MRRDRPNGRGQGHRGEPDARQGAEWRRAEPGEHGAALLGAILVMIILSVLGTISLNLAVQEIRHANVVRDDVRARHLAEAGFDQVIRWFHAPAAAPAEPVRGLLHKRYEGPDGSPSFFDEEGRSQFSGTTDHPDVLYDAAHPEDDRLLNDPQNGWFRSLRALGRFLRLKVYGPTRPGLLCTIEVTAGTRLSQKPDGEARSREVTKTLSVQLGAREIPALRAAGQVGSGGAGRRAGPLPLWVHWGDLLVQGDTWLGGAQEVPRKTPLAPVTGQSYTAMAFPEDRWLDIRVGGEAMVTAEGPWIGGPGPVSIPGTVHAHQEPTPGLKLSRWDYEAMKRQALGFGWYYVLGRDGLLYRNGRQGPGLGLNPETVFRSQEVGDHRGLVFIDSPDQNLATLTLETDYVEGIFFVNAHVRLLTKGPGRAVPALAPPPEGSTSLSRRIPTRLSPIHWQGVLYVTGNLVFDGSPRLYGALVVEGEITQASDYSGKFEAWYNYDLWEGLFQGLPLVYLAPGSWIERF